MSNRIDTLARPPLVVPNNYACGVTWSMIAARFATSPCGFPVGMIGRGGAWFPNKGAMNTFNGKIVFDGGGAFECVRCAL